MAIPLLIFVAAVASVVSAAPKIYSYPDYGSMENFNHGIIPRPTLPNIDYDVHYGGESTGYDNGNQNVPHSKICRPSEAQKNVAGMDAWCNANCFHIPSYCPESHCQCYWQ